jgi:filamentous hemagglutinin
MNPLARFLILPLLRTRFVASAQAVGLPQNGDQSSTTQSVISPAQITITGQDEASNQQSQEAVATLTSRDASTANNSLRDTLTLQQAQEIKDQQRQAQQNAQAAQLIGSVLTGVIGDIGNAHSTDPNWQDGGLYKTVLHGMAGLIEAKVAGGNVAAGVAAGVLNEQLIPVMSQYLIDNGVPEQIQDANGRWVPNPDFAALMQLGSGLVGAATGALAGGNTQSASLGLNTAVTATTNNYLTHAKVAEVKDCLSGKTCSSQEQKDNMMANAEGLSKQLDDEMNSVCQSNPASDACRNAVNAATQYIAMQDAWSVMTNDVTRSSQNTFNYVFNSSAAQQNFTLYYNTIDNRANFFGAMNQYEQNLGSGVQWFGGAESVSRAPLTGLGADNNASYVTFLLGSLLAGPNAPSIYQWRSDAGNALMSTGFSNFQNLYNSGTPNPVAWDIGQLRNEQQTLQPVHEEYLTDRSVFRFFSNLFTDTNIPIVPEQQGQPGGVNILDYNSRVKYGCKLLGYGAAQGCAP